MARESGAARKVYPAENEVTPLEFGPITQEQLQAYADASGDRNPIHLDETVAKQAGLPGVIAHGMLTAGFIAERALRFAQDEASMGDARVSRIQTRFRGLTFPGDVIWVGGSVRERGEDRLLLDLAARNQRGEVTTTAAVELRPRNAMPERA